MPAVMDHRTPAVLAQLYPTIPAVVLENWQYQRQPKERLALIDGDLELTLTVDRDGKAALSNQAAGMRCQFPTAEDALFAVWRLRWADPVDLEVIDRAIRQNPNITQTELWQRLGWTELETE